jgi:CheY-like chemotaxis protein
MSSSDGNTAQHRVRALVFESDDVTRDSIQSALEARGIQVLVAAEGESGVAVLLDELLCLDVLVTRLDLPQRDAWSLLHLVRRAGGERDLAIIVRAPGIAPAVRARLLEEGADAVVDGALCPEVLAEAALRAVATRTTLAGGFEAPRRACTATPPTPRAPWTGVLEETLAAA